MGEVISLLLYLLVLMVPFIGIAWLLYRLLVGSKGDDYSIK